MVYPSCCYMTTYCNVTLTVTNVMAFAEECLAVFWICAYAWAKMTISHHVDLIYKRIHFQSDI